MPIHSIPEALTFDDVLLTPAYSEILPKEVDLRTQLTRNISLNIPLLSAAMDTVTESRLAIAMAQEGGIGVIHKNMSIERQAEEVKKVKKYESGVIKDPLTVAPDITVAELRKIMQAHHISGLPVVEGEILVGIVTGRDIRFVSDDSLKVAQVMTPKGRLVTVQEGATRQQVLDLLREHRVEKILVVDNSFRLRGLITAKDIQKAKEKPFACKDASEQLRVAATVGTSPETHDRVAALIAAGVDVIVLDTAHGHSRGVIEHLKWIKQHFAAIPVIAGNIATGDAALALVEAGADGVKVGIGPGSICTTRIIAGVGVPQITAIQQVAQALQNKKIPIIADGGIRFSGDICKAIAAGASSVMAGSLFAGTDQAPGDVELYQGRTFKVYRGMGSKDAMIAGSKDRYFQDASDAEKLVPEGVVGLVPHKGDVVNVIHQLMGGLRSGMGYLGCANIVTLQQKAQFVRVTAAGMRESHVHDVLMTKQAPNYQLEE